MNGSSSTSAGKRAAFWLIYLLLLAAVTLAGGELVASLFAPAWPVLMLRPLPVSVDGVARTLGAPELVPVYNSWQLRDRERTVERPGGVRVRVAMVGDSFLEGAFVSAALPQMIERNWAKAGYADMEAINLGVSATNPIHYYHRIEQVALRLKPDVIVLVFFSGNDFVTERFGSRWLPPPIDELPKPSLLGAVAPRLTWLAVARLGLSDIGVGSPLDGEFEMLNGLREQPLSERAPAMARHLKRHYQTGREEAVLRDLMARGGEPFWAGFAPTPHDREFLQGWLLNSLVNWELSELPVAGDDAAADRIAASEMPIKLATVSWLEAAHKLAAAHGVRLVVATAPVGAVDPRFLEFWRPWPRYRSSHVTTDARHRLVVALLRERRIPVIDLREDLLGVAASYRRTDGHWTELGHQVVADRLARELHAHR
jgi:hypothetical protein